MYIHSALCMQFPTTCILHDGRQIRQEFDPTILSQNQPRKTTRQETCLLRGDSFSWYRDVFFWYRYFSIFFLVSRSLLTFTGCWGPKKTHRLIPERRRSRCEETECIISMPKKGSRQQKGDLGHLDTTKRHLDTKKDAPLFKIVRQRARLRCSLGATEHDDIWRFFTLRFTVWLEPQSQNR